MSSISDDLGGAGRLTQDSPAANRVAIAELGVIAGYLRNGHTSEQALEMVRSRLSALLRQNTAAIR